MTQRLIIVALSLVVIFLLYRLLVQGPPTTPVVVDKIREKQLVDSLATVRTETARLSTQNDSIVRSHAREKVAYKRIVEVQKVEIRKLRALIPDHVEADTAFQNYEAAMKEQHSTDSTHIVRQEATIDSLATVSTEALTNLKISDRAHTELMGMKEQEIAGLKTAVKTERRKKVLSQIAGVAAVVVTILVLK